MEVDWRRPAVSFFSLEIVLSCSFLFSPFFLWERIFSFFLRAFLFHRRLRGLFFFGFPFPPLSSQGNSLRVISFLAENSLGSPFELLESLHPPSSSRAYSVAEFSLSGGTILPGEAPFFLPLLFFLHRRSDRGCSLFLYLQRAIDGGVFSFSLVTVEGPGRFFFSS